MSLQDTLKFIHLIKLLNRTIAVLLCLFLITACANLSTPPPPEPVVDPVPQKEFIQLQNKVKHLEKLLEEKDAFILKQNLHQQEQIKAQQEAQQDTSDEVTRVQLKLHRLATKPSAASTIAEVEVAMEELKQKQISESDQALQVQAQYLLDAASKSYLQDEYTSSMNFASQAYEIINMVLDLNGRKVHINRSQIRFHVPLMLRINTNANLRKKPNANSAIIRELKKNTLLTANAYHYNWLLVLTEEDEQGWVHNSLIESQIYNNH